MKTWKESHVTKRTRKEPNQDGVYVQESCGITENSKKFVLKHLDKIGEVDRVEITWDKEDINYLTRIVGCNGSILVDGFSLGYSGEGCAGLYWLLNKTNMGYSEESIYGDIDNVGSRSWRRNWK